MVYLIKKNENNNNGWLSIYNIGDRVVPISQYHWKRRKQIWESSPGDSNVTIPNISHTSQGWVS